MLYGDTPLRTLIRCRGNHLATASFLQGRFFLVYLSQLLSVSGQANAGTG